MSYTINPLTIPLAKFRALPVETQEEFRQQVIKLSGKLVQRFLIDRGYCWILVCATTNAIRAGAEREDRIESPEEIAEFEQRMGHPAYSIYRHEVVSQEE